MARSYIKIYFDFGQRTKELNDSERGRLVMALLEYAEKGTMPLLKGNERFYFEGFKMNVDKDRENYDIKVRNGKNGGRPSRNDKPSKTENNQNKPNETEGNQNEPSETENQKIEDIEDIEEIKKEDIKEKSISDEIDKKKSSRFSPPTLEEVEKYCSERRSDVDPKRFWDYFNASNWVDSMGKPVKNWKQKVISWEGRSQRKVVNMPLNQDRCV